MTDLGTQLQAALGDAYTIERELGGGGMSRVFLAEDTSLSRKVVVKVLPPEMAGAMSVDRFRREIQVAARLQHPHVVPLLSAGHSGDLLWFTMPFVTGESLRTRLVRGELPIPEATRILREVADALTYAHKQGVVHRDIKPENVLLSEGHALVTDFGVAKAVSTAAGAAGTTSIGIAVGTPAYMAPEQASADPTADHRVDIYAFGVLAYELLVGEPPFRGRTAHEVVAAHMTQTPEPVTKRRQTVPEPLSALVMRCLEKRAADRPQNAEEITHVLDSAVTPGGHVPGYTTSGSRQPVERRSWRGLAIAGALFAGLVAAFFVWRTRDRVATDERLVVVLPFRVAGADPSLAYLREGMIDLLAAKLTGSTRVADPRSVLAAWRAAGGSESNDVDRETATRLATKLGARDVLLGEVTGGGDNVTLRATLVPVNGGDAPDATIEGHKDSIPALVDRLAIQLLALRSGEDLKSLGSVSGTPVAAIREFLEAQKLARGGAYQLALDKYLTAVRLDSNFAAAWYGVLDMQGWVGGPISGPEVNGALARTRDRLAPALRALTDVRIGPNYPVQPTLAERRRLAERATQVAPEDPLTWQYLGDVFFHWAPAEGMADAHDRALASFERALSLDSTLHTAIEHLPFLYHERGDTAGLRRVLALALSRDTTTTGSNHFLREALFRDATSGAAWRAIVRNDYGEASNVTYLAEELGVSLRAPDSVLASHSARAVTDAERAGRLGREARIAYLRGQPARAARVDSRTPGGVRGGRAAYVVFENLLGDADSATAKAARDSLEVSLPRDSVPLRLNSAFAAAAYDITHRKVETGRSVIASLRAPACRTPNIPTLCTDIALILDALLASTESRSDAGAKLAQADSMLRVGPVQSGLLLHAGNLIVSRLWEKAGDQRRALEAVKRRVVYYGGTGFHGTYLREEARLSALTGDRENAVKRYRQYLALRDDVEPSLKGHIESVKRELARLEREQAGR